MLREIRSLVPKWVINYGKHFPAAVLANVKYGFPGRKIRVIGVTGTDGKTTTVNMIYRILKDAGKKVSLVSTINAEIAGKSYDTGFHVTSPDPQMVQKFLRQAVDHGDEFLVLEVTSHALDQFRVWGIPFEVGVITNITREHLDYHKTLENYRRAKLRLIRGVKTAVVNQKIREIGEIGGKVVTFGLDKGDFNQKRIGLKLKMPGGYNIENALAALVVASVLGIAEKAARKSLENFTSLPGRMEEIKNNRGIKVVVDFGHTPNALEQALKTLRPETKGRLIAVFGAAGERDRGKRPFMGETAGKMADVVILTDEDPRFEDGNKIVESLAEGVVKAGKHLGKNLFIERDREKAIKMALHLAKRGETVGIFGKGHERSMSYRGAERPWSDQATVRKELKNQNYG